uniref:G_PROTEIN_RECEP_F1_2 domain-containing protein n=1 Tax=Gongylonema pulchrum TaxID=637853 RepID=A0A183CXM2_9BILA
LPTVIIYVFIFLAGVFGNVCTCAVIASCSFMHSTTNYYLFSLAISDLLILIIGLPMELYDVLGSTYPYKFGSVICKLRAFLVEFTSYASILIISAFTTERWFAICFPLHTRHSSSMTRAFKVIPIAWSIAFLAALPMAFVVKVNRLALPLAAINSSWSHLVSDDGQTIINTEFCAMDVNKPNAQKFLIYFAFTVFFLLPGKRLFLSRICLSFSYFKDKYQKKSLGRNTVVGVINGITFENGDRAAGNPYYSASYPNALHHQLLSSKIHPAAYLFQNQPNSILFKAKYAIFLVASHRQHTFSSLCDGFFFVGFCGLSTMSENQRPIPRIFGVIKTEIKIFRVPKRALVKKTQRNCYACSILLRIRAVCTRCLLDAGAPCLRGLLRRLLSVYQRKYSC